MGPPCGTVNANVFSSTSLLGWHERTIQAHMPITDVIRLLSCKVVCECVWPTDVYTVTQMANTPMFGDRHASFTPQNVGRHFTDTSIRVYTIDIVLKPDGQLCLKTDSQLPILLLTLQSSHYSPLSAQSLAYNRNQLHCQKYASPGKKLKIKVILN